jgi:poly-gamma-glutamate synthase PgsB/CapB
MTLLLALAGGFIVAGALEYRSHRASLRRIPLRIHVNGTRGKSSVTRLIAAGLREGGVAAVAKTTGSAPRMIWEDGSETPVVRHGPPNIREQLGVVAAAARRQAQALVVECMAIQPELQILSERKMIRSHIGVITNARPDHLDVMGPTVRDVALALSGTIPKKAKAFTAENQWFEVLNETAVAQGTALLRTDPGGVGDDEMASFSYLEHRENVALALAVCAECGVEREAALRGMRSARPDPGALRVFRVRFFRKEITFINALAANDPVSTRRIWDLVKTRYGNRGPLLLLYNNRSDRLQRAEQFGRLLATELQADHYLLMGGLARAVYDAALRSGVPMDRATNLEGTAPDRVFETVLDLTEDRSVVLAVGNIGGDGQNTVDYFRHRGEEIGP